MPLRTGTSHCADDDGASAAANGDAEGVDGGADADSGATGDDADEEEAGADGGGGAGADGDDAEAFTPTPGVASNGSQPSFGTHASTQACILFDVTEYVPSAARGPGVYPTTSRAGMPSVRAISANVPANCTQ